MELIKIGTASTLKSFFKVVPSSIPCAYRGRDVFTGLSLDFNILGTLEMLISHNMGLVEAIGKIPKFKIYQRSHI